MKITNSKIKKYLRKADDLESIQKELSEMVLDAKKNKNEKVSFMAEDKKGDLKKIDVTENDLWGEIYHVGTDKETRAKEYLQNKYPKVFEVAEKEREATKELKDYAIKELGVDFQKIKLSDIIRLIQGILDGRDNN